MTDVLGFVYRMRCDSPVLRGVGGCGGWSRPRADRRRSTRRRDARLRPRYLGSDQGCVVRAGGQCSRQRRRGFQRLAPCVSVPGQHPGAEQRV